MIEIGGQQNFAQGGDIFYISTSGMRAVAGANVIQMGPRCLSVSTATLTAGKVNQLNSFMRVFENMKMSNTTDQMAQLQMLMQLFNDMQRTTSTSG